MARSSRPTESLRPFDLGRRWLLGHPEEALTAALSLAVATAVVAFALGLGGSLQRGIRRQALGNLGSVGSAVVSSSPIPDANWAWVKGEGSPAVVLTGFVQNADPDRPSGARVTIMGIDADAPHELFGIRGAPRPGECWLPERAARELQAKLGDDVLASLPRFANAPTGAWFRRTEPEAALRTVRLTVARVLPDDGLGAFSLQTGSRRRPTLILHRADASRAWAGAVGCWNALLCRQTDPNPITSRLRASLLPAALGIVGKLSKDGRVGFLHPAWAFATVKDRSVTAYAYELLLAEDTRGPSGGASYVTAASADLWSLRPRGAAVSRWLAERLGLRPGGRFTACFLRAESDGSFRRVRAEFHVERVYDKRTWLGDPGWTAPMEGLSDASTITDWRAPFPFDASKVTPADEEYWRVHRAAPKFVLSPDAAKELGIGERPHSLLLVPTGKRLLQADLDRVARKLTADSQTVAALPLRKLALESAQGSSDFRALFAGMAVVVALAGVVLAASAMSLSLHRRRRSVGLALAIGVEPRWIHRALRMETSAVALVGSIAGSIAAAGSLSVGAPLLASWVASVAPGVPWHQELTPLEAATAVLLVCGLSMVAAERVAAQLLREPPLQLLSGSAHPTAARTPAKPILPFALMAFGAALASAGGHPAARSSGAMLAALAAFGVTFRASVVPLSGVLSLARVTVAGNPRATGLQAGLAAFAACLVGTLASFAGTQDSPDRIAAATGGTQLSVQLAVGLPVTPSTPAGRRRLGFDPASEILFSRVRWHELPLAEGDEAGCLNAARPVQPALAGLPEPLLGSSRFRLQEGNAEDGRALVDAETARWILHVRTGQSVQVAGLDRPLVVSGLLEPSILAGTVLVTEDTWRRLLPNGPRHRWFLLEVPSEIQDAVIRTLGQELADFGPEIVPTRTLWNEISAVQRSYLQAFLWLSLAAAFLVAFGSATTTARRVLGRRADAGLLQALGHSRRVVATWLGLEAMVPTLGGALWGSFWSLVGTWPSVSLGPLAGTHAAAVVAGVGASLGASWALWRYPVLQSLRSP